MKPLFILPILLGLAACDKPTTDVELDCFEAYHEKETIISAKTYKDKAIIRVNGGKEIVLKGKKSAFEDSASSKHFEYEGVMPETNEKIELGFSLNTVDGTIGHHKIRFGETDSYWGCDRLYKFKGKYKKPSKEELCIEEIERSISLESDEDVQQGQTKKLFLLNDVVEYRDSGRYYRSYPDKFVLPQEDALNISRNWDYNNMKLYNNSDGKLEDYEKDACEVAARLKDYIKSKGFDKYKTVYKSSKNNLSQFADYSWMKNQEIKSVAELGGGYLDIRSIDCSNKDLSGYNPEKISFDNGTEFPKDTTKMPKDFDVDWILDVHRNPGLNVRKLHEMGIDGSGVSMAIIDTKLAPHFEYNDNLTWYEEILFDEHNLKTGPYGEMHGSAVSSIAVGKTVGVAPKAKLYYFAADLTDGIPSDKKPETDEDEKNLRTSKYYASVLRRILNINRDLPDNEKIVVVSVSANPAWSKDSEEWNRVLKHAKENGVFVTTTGIEEEYGLIDNGVNRDLFGDPNDPNSYSQASWQVGENPSVEVQKKTLCFPMDHRTTAAPNGWDYYVHYANGGWSWMKPFEAGMYVLAKQVKPTITPEEFFKVGLETGTYSERAKCVLVNPVALIEALKK